MGRGKGGLRLWVQAGWTALTNGYAAGFLGGKIYTGPLKNLCVPGLSCYSCPGALGACPIGALQAALGGMKRHFPFYVLGMLMLFGVVLGRVVCGLLCPFGLVQDLLHKLPFPKVEVPRRIDRPARYVKYVVLLVLVVLLPAFALTDTGVRPPYFCQYVCPAFTKKSTNFLASFPIVPIPYSDGREEMCIKIPPVLMFLYPNQIFYSTKCLRLFYLTIIFPKTQPQNQAFDASMSFSKTRYAFPESMDSSAIPIPSCTESAIPAR